MRRVRLVGSFDVPRFQELSMQGFDRYERTSRGNVCARCGQAGVMMSGGGATAPGLET